MRIFLIFMLTTLLAACASDPIPRQPQLDVEVVTNKFAMQLQGSALNDEDKVALRDFIYQRGEPSSLRVLLSSYNAKGQAVAADVVALLKAQQVFPSQVTVQHEQAKNAKADFTLLVESYRSLVPNCNAATQADSFSNKLKHSWNSFNTSPNFGCANANALAQMVANPRDLVVGQTLSNTQGRKAVSTVERYYQPSNRNQNDNDKTIATSVKGD